MAGYHIKIDELCRRCGIGGLITAPVPISGGLLHQMYDVSTTAGRFVVKVLNPEIMARSGAFGSYAVSEKIARKLSGSIPVSCAKRCGENDIQELEGQYYLIYDFINGKSLRQREITPRHAQKVGAVVAKIHTTDFSELNLINVRPTNPRVFDWLSLARTGESRDLIWHPLITANLEKLSFLTDRMNESRAALSSNETICHGDLDSKNVLWQNNIPTIIDWESAWFYNPCHDFLDTALYWSKNENESIDYMRFSAFIDGYRSIKIIQNTDWKTVLYSGYSAKLGWLYYNLKRSAGVDCYDEAE